MTRPNRFICNSSPHVTGCFGGISAITHMHHVAGLGHDSEHLRVSLEGGLVLEITQAFATELARRLPESLADLTPLPDVSGSFTELEEM